MDFINTLNTRVELAMRENETLFPMAVAVAVGTLVTGVLFARAKPKNRKVRYTIDKNEIKEHDPSMDRIASAHKSLAEAFEANCTNQIKDKGRWDYAWRIQQLYGLRDMVEENREAYYQAAYADIGRTRSEFVIEMGAAFGDLDYMIAGLKSWMSKKPAKTPLWMQPGSSYTVPEPLGVCLVLGAYNYSVMTTILPLAGAIAAGNAVMAKPSELCPAQSEFMARMLPKYIDPACICVVQGGPETSKHIVDEYNWGKVFFTGGNKVGASISASCAARLIPVCLELGGKSPTVVLEDANLSVASKRILQGKFINSGQTCIAPDYVMIVGDDKRRKAVTEALMAELRVQFPGDVMKHPQYARMVNARHYSRVEKLMTSGGGKVVYGGKCDAANKFIEPTLIEGCGPDSAIMQEEIFGPLLPLIHVKSDDEAIKYIRAKPTPLTLYVFSGSNKRAEYIMSRTSAGSGCINEAVFQYLNPALPFGGVGASGSGAYHGAASFYEFSHQKSIIARSTMLDIPIRYLPYLGEDWVQRIFEFLLVL
jgi:aldehyde dehydrogenase (NAD+)